MNTATQQPPSCREVCECLPNYLTPVPGDDWLTPGKREAFNAHLEDCHACREEMAELDKAINNLRSLKGIEIPKDSLMRITSFVEKLEAKSDGTAESNCRFQRIERTSLSSYGKRCKTRIQSKKGDFFWISAGVIAAVFFCVSLVSSAIRSPKLHKNTKNYNENEILSFVKEHMVTVSTIPHGINSLNDKSRGKEKIPSIIERPMTSEFFQALRLNKPESILSSLEMLLGHYSSRSEMREALTSTEWVEIADSLETFLDNNPDVDPTGTLYRWLSIAHENNGAAERSRRAFLAGVDIEAKAKEDELKSNGADFSIASKLKMEITYNRIQMEVIRLFDARDIAQTLAYTDILMSRFPGEEPARFAKHMACMEFYSNKDNKGVLTVGEDLFFDENGDNWTKKTVPIYTSALINEGMGKKAARLWQLMADKSENHWYKANCLYNAFVALLPPSGDLSSAIHMHRTLIQNYSDTPFADYARKEMARHLISSLEKN